MGITSGPIVAEKRQGCKGRGGFPPFPGALPDLIFYPPSEQVEAAGSPSAKKQGHPKLDVLEKSGAGDGARTRYLHLGKVALYQMSYARMMRSR